MKTEGRLGRNIPPITKYPTLYAGRNTHVAQIVSGNEDDADFIVKAWNSYDELIAALRAISETTKGYPNGSREGEIAAAALAKAGAA